MAEGARPDFGRPHFPTAQEKLQQGDRPPSLFIAITTPPVAERTSSIPPTLRGVPVNTEGLISLRATINRNFFTT